MEAGILAVLDDRKKPRGDIICIGKPPDRFHVDSDFTSACERVNGDIVAMGHVETQARSGQPSA